MNAQNKHSHLIPPTLRTHVWVKQRYFVYYTRIIYKQHSVR